jgi:hypothetical protein
MGDKPIAMLTLTIQCWMPDEQRGATKVRVFVGKKSGHHVRWSEARLFASAQLPASSSSEPPSSLSSKL